MAHQPAVYVDLHWRRIVGVVSRCPFRQTFSTLEGDLLVPPKSPDENRGPDGRPPRGRCGGDGGELNPSSSGRPLRISTSLAGVWVSPAVPPPAESPAGQPMSLWPPYRRQGSRTSTSRRRIRPVEERPGTNVATAIRRLERTGFRQLFFRHRFSEVWWRPRLAIRAQPSLSNPCVPAIPL